MKQQADSYDGQRLEAWFWKLNEARDDLSKRELLDQFRAEAPHLADDLRRMLQASESVGDFMNLPGEQVGHEIGDTVSRVDEARSASDQGATSRE